MKRYLAVIALFGSASLYAQEYKNVASMAVPIFTLSAVEGDTYFSMNGFASGEYDRSITDLISLFGRGTFALLSGKNTTLTTIGFGGGLRFWFLRNFSGLYLGPAGGLLVVPSRTYFVLGGEVGYRLYLGERFALSFGGGPELRMGTGPSVLSVGSYISVGYAF